MTFSLDQTGEVRDTVARTSSFVREVVIPVEDAAGGDIAEAGGDAVRRELQAEAKGRGLLSPHGPVEQGGLGLGMVQRAPVFEAAGYSLFGPLAVNCAASTRATSTSSPTSRPTSRRRSSSGRSSRARSARRSP